MLVRYGVVMRTDIDLRMVVELGQEAEQAGWAQRLTISALSKHLWMSSALQGLGSISS